MTFSINHLRDAKTVEDLGADPLTLLTEWEAWLQKSGRGNAEITITGGVPKDSVMGRLVRLGWAETTVVCAPACWDLYCPNPDKHANRFRLTSAGRAHAERLTGSGSL